MEGLHCLKCMLEENDFLCKIELKDIYFSVPPSKNSQKNTQVCLVRESIPVSLHLFWSRSCTTDFYQMIENSNNFIEKNDHFI